MFYGRLIKLVFPTRVGKDRQPSRWPTSVVSLLLTIAEVDVRATYSQHGCPGNVEWLIRYVTRDGWVARFGVAGNSNNAGLFEFCTYCNNYRFT